MGKGWTVALLASLLVCLPCVVTVLVALGGLALLSAAWGALRDNVALVLLGGMAAGLVIAGAIYRIRGRAKACCETLSTDEQGQQATGTV